MYCSFMKEHPWVEHLTCLPKRGVGALLSVSAFNHERAPMSYLQQLDVLKANKLANDGIPATSKLSSDGTQHSERHHVTVNIV